MDGFWKVCVTSINSKGLKNTKALAKFQLSRTVNVISKCLFVRELQPMNDNLRRQTERRRAYA